MASKLLRGAAAAAAAAARMLSSSASAAAAPARPLYRRLSALGNAPEGSVARTMNQWLREGRRVRGIDVIRFATKLQKYGRFKHALELKMFAYSVTKRDSGICC